MPNIKELSLEEKLKLLTGKNMWQTEDLDGKLPSLFMADGPHGLRKMKKNGLGYYENIPSIAYPNFVNIANSWNRKIPVAIAESIAEDCIEKEINMLLAPGMNIKRTPLCGRNFEYFSEDPFLSGIMAKNYIDGLHHFGIAACAKHFCLNNRETSRYCQSSEVSERALHEIYLTSFKIALTANPEAVMTSYNPVNGVYASENKKLLTELLRNRMRYNGLIISDWMGVKNSYKALKAGTDLRMPYDERAYPELKDAYEKGLITDEEIDRAVSKIVYILRKISSMEKKHKITRSSEKRIEDSLPLAEETIVLLKNDGILPLRHQDVCVIGELNSRPYIGGGGAAEVLSAYRQTPLNVLLGDILKKEVEASKNVYLDDLNPSHNDREGLLLASRKDVAVVIVGDSPATETEGKDREDIRLSRKEENLINAVANTGVKTVVIIEAGSAIDMSPWIDNVAAVVFAGYLGDTCNLALANILTGKTVPSGKLSETFPLSLRETYCKDYMGNGSVENYDDGLLVGYRFYDTKRIPVRFPFGYGLSYARFRYSDLEIEKTGDTDFNVYFTITNESDVDAKEVAQLYIKDCVSCVFKPEKELKEFVKERIPAKSGKRIRISLDKSAFSHYDVINESEYVENGEFIVMIGPSSRDLPLKQKICIELPDETQHSVY